MVVLFILGGTTAYDVLVGDDIPAINNIGRYSEERKIAFDSPFIEYRSGEYSDEEMWKAIQESVQILDKVCPESAEWVRDRHKQGCLHWDSSDGTIYAKYDYYTGCLTINPILFGTCNARRASILAHEFRHSRQNYTKFLRSVFAHSVLGEPKTSIVEDDAELFEAQVLLAIIDAF